jgi:hypothetical protein
MAEEIQVNLKKQIEQRKEELVLLEENLRIVEARLASL